MNKLIPIALVIVIIAIGLFLAFNQGTSGEYDEFAKCLTEKNVKMYGAYWCSHCQNQKKAFGSSFQYIQYVECDQNGEQAPVCTQAGVTGYPTWIFPDGSKIAGEVTMNQLSAYSGCSLSNNSTK